MKSGVTFQILTALSVGEAEFYAVVKGCQVGLSLRSLYMDPGIQMKVEIQSDSSSSNSLTDRFGAGPDRNTLTHFIFGCKNEYETEISVSRKFLPRKLCRCWNEASLFLHQHYTSIAQITGLVILLTMDPTLHYKMMGRLVNRARVRCVKQKERDTCWEWFCWLRRRAKLSDSFQTMEELSTR